MKKTVSGLLLAGMLCGCTKEKVQVPDTQKEAPMVKLIKPTKPEFYKQGDNLCVTANASSQNQLARVTLSVLRAETGQQCIRLEYPTNGKTYLLDTEIPVNASMSGNCLLVLEARDVFGNTGVARQNVTTE